MLGGPEAQQLQEVSLPAPPPRGTPADHLRPQRDLIGQIASGAVELPGLDDEARRYFRDVHDHLIRLTEQVDVYRDLSHRRDGRLPVQRVQPTRRCR